LGAKPGKDKKIGTCRRRIRCDNPASQLENEVKHDEVFIVVLRKFFLEANLHRHYRKNVRHFWMRTTSSAVD
jgi:hypothetical protein